MKQISTILQRELYVVNFSSVIDSRLGQTAKNITKLFAEINSFTRPDQAIVLFDEIDALALDRIDSHDIREMGRAATGIMNDYAKQFSFIGKNIRLFKKILSKAKTLPYPGEMKNLIRSAIAFSNPNDENDYLRRIYTALIPDGANAIQDIRILHKQGFTLREIEILTGISRSTAAREMRDTHNE